MTTTIKVMASPISTSMFLCTSSVSSKSTACYLSPLISYPRASNIRFSKWFPQLGPAIFSQWNGLKHLGISISPNSLKLEERRRCKSRVVRASLFGVGAPEALVIGVVALLVFGPKGLAEVARTMGKTLRAFQPTIKELQEVSKELKSTLEREIGLDEVTTSTQNTLNSNSPYLSKSPPTPSSPANTEESSTKAEPNGTPSVKEAYTSEEYLKITEEQLKASASQQLDQPAPPGENQLESRNQHEATPKETAATMPSSQIPESET